MPLPLKVEAQLDRSSADQAADEAVRIFSGASDRIGQELNRGVAGHGRSAASTVTREFDENLVGTGTRAATTIGGELSRGMVTHGATAAANFLSGLTSGVSSGMPGVGRVLSSGVSSMTSSIGASGAAAGAEMGSGIAAGAAVAVAGLAAVVVAAYELGQAAYDVGSRFDALEDTMAVKTAKMGDDLDALNNSVREVGRNTASSLEDINNIAAGVTQSLDLSGQPLEQLTKNVADFNRMTGDTLNVRDFGKVIHGFGVDASQASNVLDQLALSSRSTGIPINELVSNLTNLGPSARALHLDLDQTIALITNMEKAGVDAGNSVSALTHAANVFASKGIDMQTGLRDTITQIKAFTDAGNEAAAQRLAKDVFGARGAEQLVDAIGRGQVTVNNLNTTLNTSGQTIADLDRKTADWSETWQKIKNAISETVDLIGGPLFDAINSTLSILFDPGGQDPYQTGPQLPGRPTDLGNFLYPGLAPGAAPGVNQPFGPLPGKPGAPGTAGPAPFTPSGNPTGNPFIDWFGGGPAPGSVPTPPQDIAGKIAAAGSPGSGPEIPYPADYGQGPQPGESNEAWQKRMRAIELQHDVDEKRAAVDALEADNTHSEDDLIKAKNALQAAQQNQIQNAQNAAKTGAADAAQTPLDAAYGAAPRPGETASQYAAEGRVLEAQNKTQTMRARLNDLERSGVASAEDLTKARNELAKAERDEYEAQLSLQEAAGRTAGSLGQIGAQLDADFGLSKGLPGLVENITKMLANFAAAPLLGQLAQTSASSPIQGGYGILGQIGAQNIAAGRSPLGLSAGGSPAGDWLSSMLGLPGAAATPDSSSSDRTTTASQWAVNPAANNVRAGQQFYRGGPTSDTHGLLTSNSLSLRNALQQQFPWATNIGGYRPPDGYNEHSSGQALDLMLGTANTAQAMQAMQYAFQDPTVDYVLFQQKQWNRDGTVTPMNDRGSPTQNHMDHLHIHTMFAAPDTGADVPGYAQGGSTDTVPAMLTPGEHVLTQADVAAMGGQSGVYAFRNALHRDSGGDVPKGAGNPYIDQMMRPRWGGEHYIPPQSWRWADTPNTLNVGEGNINPAMMIDTSRASFGSDAPKHSPFAKFLSSSDALAQREGIGPWSPVRGFRMMLSALGIDDPGFQGGGEVPPWTPGMPLLPGMVGGSTPHDDQSSLGIGLGTLPPPASGPDLPNPILGGFPQAPPGPLPTNAPPPGAMPAPEAGPSAPTTTIGAAVAPAAGTGPGFQGVGGLPMQIASTALSAIPGVGQAAQTGLQLANRAIAYGGQVAGILAGGLMETFLPTGGSELANHNWFTRIAGGLAGARPALPNTAGGKQPGVKAQGAPSDAQPVQPAAPINVEYHNHRASEDRAGADLTRHLSTMYTGPGGG